MPKEDLLALESHVVKSLDELKKLDKVAQVSFSGGKDSTALLALFLLAKKLGYIQTFEIAHSNTLMEMPFLDAHVIKVKLFCESQGVKFNFLVAPMKDRFMYNVLGRGIAIPNRNFRWCTEKLKIKPIQNHEPDRDLVHATGERLGESSKRDIKLKKEGCGSSGECGIEEQNKVFNNILRPIIEWSTCQVWDFIALMDIQGILPSVFSELSKIYSINENENQSMRTGCIGCPLVNKDRSLINFTQENLEYLPLIRVGDIYKRLTLKENRLVRGKSRDGVNNVSGCIKLSARFLAYQELLKIEKEAQTHQPDFFLIQDEEKQEIEYLLNNHTYPRGYNHSDQQVLDDISNFNKMITKKNIYKPFLKWVGGKTKLIPQYAALNLIPTEFNTYFEPFLGGGAMFFHLQNIGLINRALLSDLNADLINCYLEVKNNLPLVKGQVEQYEIDHCEEYFNYLKKNHVSNERFYRAAKFIYLNKACRSGMYRVNKKGEFNVPVGMPGQKIYQPTLLNNANLSLNKGNIAVINTSFFNIAHLPQPGDFVFLDPPYYGTFNNYTQEGFGENEQVKLRDICRKYSKNGVKFLLCNSHNSFILDLYASREFKINEVWRSGTINSKSKKRDEVKELVITNADV
jgi:DNA adenine methylase